MNKVYSVAKDKFFFDTNLFLMRQINIFIDNHQIK